MNFSQHNKPVIPESSPWERFWLLLSEDKSELMVLCTYTILNGLLMLAVPLTTQALVNTIAAGVFLQPLIILAFLLFLCLFFASVLRLMQFSLVESIQQRIFAKVALKLSYRLPRIELTALSKEYVPELANRFFDILTIQKTWSKILLDGPSALLQILVGLVILAFYSPLLLAFDIALITGILLVVWGLSYKGLQTSIDESYQKYDVAGWLEEIGRCHVSFKIAGFPPFTIEKANRLVSQYLQARGQHFKVLLRQTSGSYLLYTIAGTGILALGGWLVINRQLTLGQLVAAEIIVLSVLAAFEKFMRQIEPFYDLLTSIDKIGHVIDLPVERSIGKELESHSKGAHLRCVDVKFSYSDMPSVLNNLNFEILPGKKIALVGLSGSGKSSIASLLCGLQEPTHGMIEINGLDIQESDLLSLRRSIAWAGMTHEVFQGTIEENITLHRPWVTPQDLRWAIEGSGLASDLAKMPEGKRTVLVSEGRNLSLGQRQRLMIARAIVDRPQLLILDETLSAVDFEARQKILSFITEPSHPWTVIFITHLPEILEWSDEIMVLHGGQIVESGPPRALLKKNSLLIKLFPELGGSR